MKKETLVKISLFICAAIFGTLLIRVLMTSDWSVFLLLVWLINLHIKGIISSVYKRYL
jgi:hypothetical protein